MFETSYNHPIDETLSLISLIGVGQAHIKTDGLAKAVSGAVAAGITQEKRVTNLSKRGGFRALQKLHENIYLTGILQYSDYGYAETICCTIDTATFETQVTASKQVLG